MDITIQEMKNAYDKHKNLKQAASDIGMKWQTLYWYLKRENHPIVGNKSQYGSDKDRFAAKAEADFKKMIPSAIDMNKEKFQSKYDFEIHNLKVDVKASNLRTLNNPSKSSRWAFSLKKQEMIADFIVGMAYKNDELFKLFLFPSEQIRFMQSISISEHGSEKWGDYEVSKEELQEFFESTIINKN